LLSMIMKCDPVARRPRFLDESDGKRDHRTLLQKVYENH
jgi:hypothetical protein